MSNYKNKSSNSNSIIDVMHPNCENNSLNESSSSDQDDVSVSTHYSSTKSNSSKSSAQSNLWSEFSGEIFEKT